MSAPPDSTLAGPEQIITDLRRKLAERTAERDEAVAQQSAATEVLQVINSSPGDLAPVFDAMLEKAIRLCEAAFGILWTYDGELFHAVAFRDVPPAYAELLREPHRAGPFTGLGRVASGETFSHIADMLADEGYRTGDPVRRAGIELAGARTHLSIPLRNDDILLGNFAVFRTEVRPFSDRQIALLQNFAAQAVIAMENARLITETREALEQQTATAEVLGVINSSPGDLQPVFEAMLDKAMQLCGAAFGLLSTYDGERFHQVALRQANDAGGEPARFAEYLAVTSNQPGPGSASDRLLSGEHLVHIPDLSDEEIYRSGDPYRRAFVDIGGARTLLAVGLRKQDALLGVVNIYRQEVRPFTEKQIALLENFAAQAVIAMENARLITETREALEQQTATAEVLQVINASPGDLAPVFDAMLEKATWLCEAAFGILNTYDGERFSTVTLRGVPRPLEQFLLRSEAPPPEPESPPGRIIGGEDVVEIYDLALAERDRGPRGRAMVELGGARSYVTVALRKDGNLLGTIAAYRQEVRPFTDTQIALLRSFAAQAVIAMENARLITETRQALEQQTATAEVLQVINSSPGDLAPVFSAILEKAHTSCGTAHGSLQLYDGEILRAVATQGVAPEFAEILHRGYGAADSPASAALIAGERFFQIADTAKVDHPVFRSAAELAGIGTVLFVPLLKEETFLGLISAARREVRPFTEKQIALLQNFAAQAVIAMENARLITETREALERQTATAEILRVISSSPTDVQPTFDAIAESAVRVCGAASGGVFRFDGSLIHFVAHYGWTPDELAAVEQVFPIAPGPGSVTARAIMTGSVVHVPDIAVDLKYAQPALVESGFRTTLAVPMLRDGVPVGAITVPRREVSPFTDAQIELLKTFADQAVIAIENTRLFNELQDRTRDLQESLEQQQAIAEVLGVINSSPGDLQPVFDILLDKAMVLCGAAFGALAVPEGNAARNVAVRGAAAFAEYRRHNLSPATPGSIVARWLSGEPVVHIADVKDDDLYRKGDPARRALVDLAGARSVLYVGLQKDEKVLGAISVFRQEVRPFSEKEIALLQSFAAQAVIAMDNARLLNEIRQRQAELRVTFDNMGDGVAMFDTEFRLAAWNRNFQEMLDLPDAFLAERPLYADYVRHLAERGEFGADDVQAELSRRLEHTDEELRLERTRPDGRVVEVRRNSVAGGGMVLIYGDITERKRSEGKIRAARDAAEKALAELRTAQASLIHAEKMASLGQLTAGIAHEIKNPLNFVNNFAGLSVELLDELKESTAPGIATLDENTRTEIDETVEMLTSNLEKIAEHGKRADGIVKSMLEHSRGVTGERREVDLNALVEEALNLAYHGARAQDQSFNITMERDLDPHLAPIALAPQEITRVFLNLFGNGFYAAAKHARETADGFRPVLTVTTRDLGEAVEVRVRDNGTGIPPEIKDKLFQPFFTTKPTGEGTGLGLSISYDIVTQEHGGTIEVESEPDSFTEFTVRLPRH